MQQNFIDLPVLIGQLFQIVQRLGKMFRGRPFTPDGHLVGSIGEVVAAYTYGLILERCSNEGFDAKTKAKQTVEIKLTGGDKVAVSSDAQPPDILIVLKLDSKIGFTEIYNGKFPEDLWRSKKANKRRIKFLPLSELKRLNPTMLKQEHPLAELNVRFEPAN